MFTSDHHRLEAETTSSCNNQQVQRQGLTGDSGTVQAPETSTDRGDTEEASEAAGVSFSLCLSPPSSHRSDVILASWLCLQTPEEGETLRFLLLRASSRGRQRLHLQLLHRVGRVRCIAGWRVPQVQRAPPQTHLHVPGASAVLPVLVGRGWVELRVPQVSVDEINRSGGGA